MKKFIQKTYKEQLFNVLLLLVRLAIGCFMLYHGIPKFEKFFADEQLKFADPIGLGVPVSLALTVFAEVFCSIFIIIGYGTRIATIPLIIMFIVIVWKIHARDPFKDQELAWHYLLTYILLLITGSGKYSIDSLIK